MTDHPRRVTRALLSVSDKTGLIEFARALAGHGVDLVSTGGTAKAIAAAGLKVTDVSDLTGFPEMMDGRVKTLHPKVHGGLLAIRDNREHAEAMKVHGIAPIDLLVVNLYPFEATVDKGAGFEDCIENIDIGGPAMIRAAASGTARTCSSALSVRFLFAPTRRLISGSIRHRAITSTSAVQAQPSTTLVVVTPVSAPVNWRRTLCLTSTRLRAMHSACTCPLYMVPRRDLSSASKPMTGSIQS